VYTIYYPESGLTFENHVLDDFSYQLYLNGGGGGAITRTFNNESKTCKEPAHDCTDDIIIRPSTWAPTE
jgi:hypothetical protein